MKTKHETTKAIQNNLVAKHMNTFNSARTFDDRKQKMKNGYQKHKGKSYDSL